MTKNNTTVDKRRSTRIAVLALFITSLVTSCATWDRDREIDLRGYSDINHIIAADDEYILVREREVQDWVGTCMRTAGIEYVPWTSDNYTIAEVLDSNTPTTDSIIAQQNRTTQIKDPNEEIYENLGQTERTQYFEALWGKEDMEEGSFPSGDEDRFGCYNAAWVELYGRDAVQARWEILDLSTEIDELVRADPAYLLAEQEWASCMAAGGYDLQTPTDMANAIWLVSGTDTSEDYSDTRSFEREVRNANAECSEELDETITFLRNEALDGSAQGSINILLADIAKRQGSN